MGNLLGNRQTAALLATALVLVACARAGSDELRISERSDREAAGEATRLWGTAWRLEDLAGSGVLDRVQATLEFPEEGRASGNASCNRFQGRATASGGEISFGPLATTRQICAEAVMNQEQRYLAALGEADRFEIREPFLSIYTAGLSQPLRFVGTDGAEDRPR